MEFNSELFTKRLKYLLNNDTRLKGVFYKEVAAAGVVQGWIKRGSSPQSNKLLAIAQYFNVSTDYLVGLSDEPQQKNNSYPTSKREIMYLKEPSALPYGDNNQDVAEMYRQVSRIYKQRGPRDIDKMRLFLSTLDPGEVDNT